MKPTIIIIDDSPEDYEALARAFTKTGCQAETIHIDDGNLAIDEIIRTKPKLVLLDLNMPEMEGTELLKLIKEHPEIKTTICIIFSTSINERDIATCYGLGANAYLQKPLNFDEYITIAQTINSFWIQTNITSN